MATNYDKVSRYTMTAPWVQFFNNMKKQHVWAEGPVLYCTALLLERDIAVISLGTLKNNERKSFCGN